MSKVENVSKLKTIGECKLVEVKNGDTLVIEEKFVENLLVVLKSVLSKDGAVLKDNIGERFVPSFDATKSMNELIGSYSFKTENEDKVSVTGKVLKDENSIAIKGEGFDQVVLELFEYEPVVTKE